MTTDRHEILQQKFLQEMHYHIDSTTVHRHTQQVIENIPSYISDILDTLIHDVGTLTQKYRSDLFITWDEIRDCIADEKIGIKCFAIGIRELGVDGNTYVLTRILNNETATYKKLYTLSVRFFMNGDTLLLETMLNNVKKKSILNDIREEMLKESDFRG